MKTTVGSNSDRPSGGGSVTFRNMESLEEEEEDEEGKGMSEKAKGKQRAK